MELQRDFDKHSAPLFEGWEEAILWPCLQGVMGEVYADDLERPISAAILGDFCFQAGGPRAETALSWLTTYRHPNAILIPRSEGWDAHNGASAALAEQLGYRYGYPYTAFRVWREKLQ